MVKKGFSIKRLFKSFGYALHGIHRMIIREQNAKVHTLVACCVIVAGFYFRLSAFEWIAIVISISSVLAAEIFNTSIETLSDKVSPEYNKSIKQVKDFAAGGVLIIAIAAVIIGLIIFVPKIIACF
ncbi:MAG: diacylglycerol kinase family protein [Tannerella sp.]|jgi:diacylglycerol kinase (ATP)|nr:diacylglycerol kinase family protein [Tannerella sp.]